MPPAHDVSLETEAPPNGSLSADHAARDAGTRIAARRSVRPLVRIVEQAFVYGFALWAALLVLRGHLPYLRFPAQMNMDEGYLLAVGQRMLHGHLLPFVDGVAHSGPLFLLSGAPIVALDEFGWFPIRLAAALGFTANALLIFACGVAAKRPLAGAIGATAVPLYTIFWCQYWDGIAYNAELPVNLCALLAVFAALRAVGDDTGAPSTRWLAATGFFVACTGMSKQVGALNAVPITLYVAAGIWDRCGESRARRRLLLVYLGAAAAPVVLLVLWFAMFGALHDLYYYAVVYNRDIYMTPFKGVSRLHYYIHWILGKPTEMAVTFGAVAWGSAQLFAARKRTSTWAAAYRAAGLPLMASQLTLLAVIGARASMRNFDHYYILVLPWLGLCAGLLADSDRALSTNLRESAWTFARQLIVCLPFLIVGELTMRRRGRDMEPWLAARAADPELEVRRKFCNYVATHSKPEDRIFVWGFRAEYYVTCRRLPASRFVFTTFVAGYVPWENGSTKEEEDARSVPGSRALLIAELEQTKPPIIVDTGNSTMYGRTMARYGELSRYLDTHYRLAEVLDNEPIYLRTAP